MYAKLFASLYQGTLRGCSDEILVFTNLIAHADSTGMVDKHFKAIAEETGLDIERVKAAIANLEAPDPESRSPEMEGRRIVKLDEHRVWGWQIVNHGKYRAIRSEEDRREQNRIAQAKWREKHKADSNISKQSKPPSAEHKQKKPRKPKSAQAEAEAEAEEERREAASPPALSEAVSIYFEIFPQQHINIYQQELITDRVSDLARWRAVLLEWKANGWVARNVNNILNRYDTFTEREKKYGKPETGTRKANLSTAEVLEQIGATPG